MPKPKPKPLKKEAADNTPEETSEVQEQETKSGGTTGLDKPEPKSSAKPKPSPTSSSEDGDLPEAATSPLGSDDVPTGEVARFKAYKNQDERIAILDPSSIHHARRHFFDGVGYVLCLSTQDRTAICCKTNEAKLSFSTWIVRYLTDRDGTPKGNPPAFEVIAWNFGIDKYRRLVKLYERGKAEDGTLPYDIHVECKNEQFQGLQLDLVEPCLWMTEELLDDVWEEYEAAMVEIDLKGDLGRRLPEADLSRRLSGLATDAGGIAPSGGRGSADDVDFDDVVGDLEE